MASPQYSVAMSDEMRAMIGKCCELLGGEFVTDDGSPKLNDFIRRTVATGIRNFFPDFEDAWFHSNHGGKRAGAGRPHGTTKPKRRRRRKRPQPSS